MNLAASKCLMEILMQIRDIDPFLLHCVPVSYGYGIILHRRVVYSYSKWCSYLLKPAITPADRP